MLSTNCCSYQVFLFFFCWGLTGQITGQERDDKTTQWFLNQVDSLIHYGDLGDSVWVYQHVDTLMHWSKQTKNHKATADCYKALGLLENLLVHQRKAVQFYDSAYYYYKIIQDTSGITAVLNNRSDPLSSLGHCTRAIAGFTEAFQLVNQEKDVNRWLALKFNQAKCLLFCEQFELCIQFGEEALPIAREENQPYIEVLLMDLVGFASIETGNPNYALELYTKTLATAKELQDPSMLSGLYNNRGNAYLELEDYEKAYSDFLLSLDIQKRSKQSLQNDGNTYINLGVAANALGKMKESIAYFERGLQMITDKEDFIFLAEAYEWASEAYMAAKNYEKAYQALHTAKQWRDSVLNLEIKKEIQSITAKYENEKLKKELAEASLMAANQKIKGQFYISILIVSVLGSLFLYLTMINRQKRLKSKAEKKQIELEYGLLRARMNPHFLFNSLNSIQSFFANNQFRIGNDFLVKFSKLIRRVLDQCNKTSISLSEELETLKLYMEMEQLRLENRFSYQIEMAPIIEEDLVQLPPLILQPFAENAIWHGISPKNEFGTINIEVNISDDQEFLLCSIRDNGIGLKKGNHYKEQNYKPQGIKITRERLGQKGEISIQNIENDKGEPQGTEVNLKIPILDEH